MGPVSALPSMKPRRFFRPAFYAVGLLAAFGIVKDTKRAAKWLCDHAMRLVVKS